MPLSSRVSVLAFDVAAKQMRPVEPGVLDALPRGPGRFVWADVESPEPAPFLSLLKSRGVELGEAGRFDGPEILPRILEQPGFLSFQLFEVADPDKHLDSSRGVQELEVERLVLVLGDGFIFTYHARPLAAVSVVRAECERNFKQWGRTAGFLAFLLIDRCLYDCAHLNLANDNFLDQLEEQLLGHDAPQLAEDVSKLGRNILLLKKLGSSLQIVLMTLAAKRSAFVSDEAREFYHEMLQNAIAVRSAIDSSRDLLDGVVASLQAQTSHRTAEVARLLTIVSTVMLPLTVITGVYGMNFQHMPELGIPGAYQAVLGFMAGVASLLLLVFWRIGWLRTGGGLSPGAPRR